MYFIDAHQLTPSVSGTASYRYPDWATGTVYNRGNIVRDTTDNADYKCNLYSFTSTTRPGAASTWYWTRLNANGAAETVATFKTNIQISSYATWAGSVAIVKGERRYDDVAHKDYEALVAISSGSNTLRPSVAVTSATAAIAGYWLEIGPSNLWALFDDDVDTLAQITTSGYFIFDVYGSEALEAVDALAIVGCNNVATVTIQRISPVNDAVLSTTTVDMNYTTATGRLKDVISSTFTAVDNPRFKITFAATVGSPYQVMTVGKVVVGKKVEFGNTVENVNVSIIDYSQKTIDETFGTYTFIRRGFSKIVTAQIMVEHAQGDEFSQWIESVRAVPTFWNFNTAGQSLARVMVYGAYKSYSCVLQGIPWDTYSLEVTGLVS